LKILAIDCSSKSGSVAIVDGDTLVGELTYGAVGTHSEKLMSAIDELLKSTGFKVEDCDYLALATGPGSFTGLRIGVSIVKGLALAAKKKVIGVSTLEALSLNFATSALDVCPLLDARKKEVYTALFRYRNGQSGLVGERILEDSVISPDKLFKVLSGTEGSGMLNTVFLGDGISTYADEIKENVGGAILAPEYDWPVRGVHVAALAARDFSLAVSPEELSPIYLRKSEAEIKKQAAK
jgi:tRNA threonylcarbamoyladenosine biosynthesis protein TsaB